MNFRFVWRALSYPTQTNHTPIVQCFFSTLSHIISAVFLHRAGQAERNCALSATSLLTHALSLSLFTIPPISSMAPGPILAATVPRLATRPWPPLTNGAERRFRISKKRDEGGGRLRIQRETETDREAGQSLTVHQHFRSWVYSSQSIWALQKPCARLKPDLPAAVCSNRHVLCQTSTSSLILSSLSFFLFVIFHHETWSLPKEEIQHSWSSCWGKTCN